MIYSIWIIHNSLLKLINKQDKTLAFTIIKKHLSIIFFLIYYYFRELLWYLLASFLYYIKYYNYIYNNINIGNIDMILLFFRLGFACNVFGFCYYYGSHLMKSIYKPIFYEFIPSELKDDRAAIILRLIMRITYFSKF